MTLPITGLTNGINTPSVSNIPSSNTAKPSTVVKIDTQTGKGVPGGFSGSSNLKPASLISKLSSTASAISSAKTKVISALNTGQKGVTTATLNKLNGMQSSVTSKLKSAASAPDFTRYQPILPKPVDMPAVPDFKSAGIDVPNVPSSISTTSEVNIPTPAVPKIG